VGARHDHPRARAPADAIPLLTVARDHYAACSDVCSLDAVAADLAAASNAAGREREAGAVCELALAPERPLGERNTHLLHEAAMVAARTGDAGRAARLAAAAATAANRDPVAIGPWHAPVAAGDVALMADRVDAARAHYERALALATAVRARAGPSLPIALYLAQSELRLAAVAAAAGDDEAAEAHADAALDHARAGGAPAVVEAAVAAR
jgi:tetratricopeptide (TPR) repeat protein